MTKEPRSKVKKGELKMFLLFLLVAFLLWFLTKFSKDYIDDVTVKIEYVNFPSNQMLTKNNTNEMLFNIEASGFEFLYYSFKKPIIQIDVSKYVKNNNNIWLVEKQDVSKILSNYFKANIIEKNSVQEIILDLDERISKMIPIQHLIEISYKKGFYPLDSIKLVPDSVLVSGSKSLINAIGTIYTETSNLANIFEEMDSKIALNVSSLSENIEFNILEVNYSQTIEEFTQAEMIIPIELINVAENLIVQLFPSTLKVSYLINFENFKEITENDFKIICDFAEANENTNYLIPKLIKSPDMVINISLEPTKVDYIIIK